MNSQAHRTAFLCAAALAAALPAPAAPPKGQARPSSGLQVVQDPVTIEFGFANRHWSAHGDYLFDLGDQIQASLTKATQSLKLPSSGKVSITVEENRDGEITRVLGSSGSPGVPSAVIQACVAAIKAGSPYKKWTGPMYDEMGEKQFLVVVFTFHNVH